MKRPNFGIHFRNRYMTLRIIAFLNSSIIILITVGILFHRAYYYVAIVGATAILTSMAMQMCIESAEFQRLLKEDWGESRCQ